MTHPMFPVLPQGGTGPSGPRRKRRVTSPAALEWLDGYEERSQQPAEERAAMQERHHRDKMELLGEFLNVMREMKWTLV